MSAPKTNPRHVLVTGGAGFIGSHLVERLIRDGRHVVVIDDLSTGSADNLAAVQHHSRFRFVQSRVSECPDLDAWVSHAESVYHLAAAVGVEMVLRHPVRTIENNLRETEAVLEAASRQMVPVLLASTSEVYGKSVCESFDEEDDLVIGPPHLTRWGYACSKLMDEFLALAHAKEHALPVVIARIFNTVGPRQTGRYGMVFPRFITAALSGAPLRIFGDGRQTRCFCHVTDTVEALVRLQDSPAARGKPVNVGGTAETSILDLAQLVITTLGSKSSIEHVPYDEAYPPGFEELRRRRPSIRRLSEITGFTPATTLVEMIHAAAGRS